MKENMRDIVIIGGGPAGFTAGLYAARARMNVLLVESLSVIGQAAMTEVIENYPGVEKTGGVELVMSFKKQAEAFGLECRQGTVKNISRRNENERTVWRIEDETGVNESLSLVIASGARAKKLRVPGEEEFTGRGVSYCATCDAPFFREKDIVVVGGGDTAAEEALFLTRFGKRVTIIHRRDRLRASGILRERVSANKKMEFVWNSVVEEIRGAKTVEKVMVKDLKTGKKSDIPCDGVFIFTGWRPNTDFLGESGVEMNKTGHVMADRDMKTSQAGIFAAGDCCEKSLNQIVTACGDGAIAAFSAQHYVEKLKGTAYE
ncbi:MAG: thioredoxin-disulfide reductase [Candidatus Omnitrophota bacterium]